MIFIIIVVSIIFSSPALAVVEIDSPTEQDKINACKVIAYEAVQHKKSMADLQVLYSVFKLTCAGLDSPVVKQLEAYFEGIADGNSFAKATCLDFNGYIMARGGGPGWVHRDLQSIVEIDRVTNGGWNHLEVKEFLEMKPMLDKVGKDELLRFIDLKSKGVTLTDLENANSPGNRGRFNRGEYRRVDQGVLEGGVLGR